MSEDIPPYVLPALPVQEPVGEIVLDLDAAGPGSRIYADLYPTKKLAMLAPGTKLYATPAAPDVSGLLRRVEKHLTNWLEMDICECEYGHSCGRNQVKADRDAVRAALSAYREKQGGEA